MSLLWILALSHADEPCRTNDAWREAIDAAWDLKSYPTVIQLVTEFRAGLACTPEPVEPQLLSAAHQLGAFAALKEEQTDLSSRWYQEARRLAPLVPDDSRTRSQADAQLAALDALSTDRMVVVQIWKQVWIDGRQLEAGEVVGLLPGEHLVQETSDVGVIGQWFRFAGDDILAIGPLPASQTHRDRVVGAGLAAGGAVALLASSLACFMTPCFDPPDGGWTVENRLAFGRGLSWAGVHGAVGIGLASSGATLLARSRPTDEPGRPTPLGGPTLP